MLYIIGIGLADVSDITVKGFEAVKKCSKVYLEGYTSVLQCSLKELSDFYGKEVIVANREMVEQGTEITENAKDNDVAFLVIGDPFSATTHADIMLRAREAGVSVKIIHNASVLTAVGETGLQLYKFGKVTSIPFENKDVKAPIVVLKGNQSLGLHTLFLLDLCPEEGRFLSIKDACEYLIKNGVDASTIAVGCARLGCADAVLKKGSLEELQGVDFGSAPYCLIIPGKLHFMEEEGIERL